ncbi:MAG: T9SS type A sorting domain-containing protein, partial [Bacteroidales bacterium]|nr:T9SS type A sorting domain-containing protein [Bacteroidales bacterium]
VNTCEEATYIALDNRVYKDLELAHQWFVSSGGTILGSSTDDTLTVQWGNMVGNDTVVVHAYHPFNLDCEDWDTVIVSKTAPKLAGQVKYWNNVETPMPTPFPTEIYSSYPEDYFYLTLYRVDTSSVPPLDSLETVYVQPRLVEDLWEILSYFEFSLNTAMHGCDAEYVLKIWDGGLNYHTTPPPPEEETILGGAYTYNNWGGVNATDALAIQLMVGGSNNINGAPWNYSWVGLNSDSPWYGYYSHGVADVNSSNTYINGGVTALDGLTAKYRLVGLLGSFPHNGAGSNQFSPNFRVTGRMVDTVPEITFPAPFDYDNADDVPFTHSGVDYMYFSQAEDHNYTSASIPWTSSKKYINIYYEALGDLNASYVPLSDGFKSPTNLTLSYEGYIKTSVNQQLTIPVSIDRRAEVGALTLSFSYRNDLIEVLGTGYSDDDVFINQKDGVLNIGWYSLDAMKLLEGASVVEINVRVLAEIPTDTELFTLNAISELADAAANTIEGLKLKAVSITTDNILIPGDELEAYNYPNPFIDKTTIRYVLPETGQVKLEVYDAMGRLVRTLVDQTQEAGTQTIGFARTGGLLDGIYFYRISLKAENRLYSVRKSLNITQNPYGNR